MRILDLARRAAGKPTGYLARRAFHELSKKVRSRTLRRRLRKVDAAAIARQARAPSLSAWWKTRREGGLFLSEADRFALPHLYRQHYPAESEQLRAQSARILNHEFELLGSPLTRLGPEIDWHLDFKTGFRWELKPSHKIDSADLGRPSDIKIPWEVSRCQHWTALGRAWLAFGDRRCVEEFQAQALSWLRNNPPGLGVNWICTMDVALRAVSWIWALDLFRDAPIEDDFWEELLLGLFTHGLWIPENLEIGLVNGNHYLSNALGLVACGTLFYSLPEGQKWLEQGRTILEQEICSQVDDDGVDIEASVAYHRLVLEIFLVGRIMCAAAGRPLSQAFEARFQKMFDFVHAYITPEGLSPQIGDHDDGRALILGAADHRDHRYLLSTGSVLYRRPEWKQRAGRFWEDSLWLLGSSGKRAFDSLQSRDCEESALFPISGFAILRTRRQYLLIDAGPVGFKDLGGHGHNDCLSFEWHCDGRPLITDSGCYIYTASFQWRNRFRSTAFHNTVQVDGQEINRFASQQALWTLCCDAFPDRFSWEADDSRQVFEAGHTGYRRLPDAVTVRRRFELASKAPELIIEDRLQGQACHDLEFFFHGAAGAQAVQEGDRAVAFAWACGRLRLEGESSAPMKWEHRQGWFSPSYGVKLPRPVWVAVSRTGLPASFTWRLRYSSTGPQQTGPSSTDEGVEP